HVIIDAIRDETGTLIGFAKVTRDITERIRTQQALEQAQRALFQSQKLESLGQVTGGVAHDFNNLLTAIINSIDIAQRRCTDPDLLPHLANALRAAERGTTLTQRMLAFARRQDLKVEPLHLDRLLDGVLDLIERSVGPRVSVNVHIADGTPAVLGDENQLESAVLNLALNARDAMPEGGVIEIQARTESVIPGDPSALRPGEYVVLSVTDSGVGMDESTLSRATEPFFTTKGPGEGTGLGLSMVQGFAEQIGGRLAIRSAPGAGTQVAIWLPTTEKDPETDSATPENDKQRPASAGRVLLVDDDELVRSSTSAILEECGYDVLTADSGLRALQIAAEEPNLDLLITDQMMPGMTGTQLIGALRAVRPSLPALITSGYTETGSTLAPGTMRLTKPFKLEDLQNSIQRLLREWRR
ncbi:MAG TPA: ATP-binding protein, partial [Rudaea sp.]